MKFYVKTKLSDNISETPEGFLLCRNVMLTHTGTLKYGPTEHPFGDKVGDVVMKREPEELFSPATMGSFEGKDLTIQHPDDFVDPDNYQDLTNGVLMNIRKGSETIEVEGEQVTPLLGDILVKAKKAIELVKMGMREVSLGYDAFWELVGDGEGRHSKIVGNHCALVDEGRAGKYCAITDHKKENEIMGLKELEEKFKKVFGKSVDEAMKEKESKDAEEVEKKKKEEEEKAAKDAEEAEKAKKEKESKDSDLEAKVEKLASMVEKLLEKLAGSESSEDEEDEDVIVADEESEDESEDEESEDEGEEEDKDDKEKEKKKTGDSLNVMSRAEILAPGIKKTPDIKIKALETAYKTEDGKKIINTLSGGKAPSKLEKKAVDAIFVAAAEMMKAKRVKDAASQRVMTIDSFPSLQGKGQKSADDINKKNAEFYGKK
jgi:hypothetical protein